MEERPVFAMTADEPPRAFRANAGQRLRDLIASVPGHGPLVVPGAYDAMSAKLIERAGFDAVYLTGFGAAASLLGMPDVGLTSATEMTDHARRLCGATSLPVIADADTGFGSATNVARTVREYERAGVAAIQLEDQESPKRCGHMAGKTVIPTGEMTGKIRAALDARSDPSTVIVARTDAIATDGVDAAIDRARAYRASGADVLFVEAPTDQLGVERVAGELAGDMPLLFNWVEGGLTPRLTYDQITELGFALIVCPIGALLAATHGVQELLAEVRRAGTPAGALAELPTFDDITTILGLPEIEELARRYDASR